MVIELFKEAWKGGDTMPSKLEKEARALAEVFKVQVMGTPIFNKDPNSQQQQVINQSVDTVRLGHIFGVDMNASTKSIWDIYQTFATEVCEPVHKMIEWFGNRKPRIHGLIFTGGATKSAVMRNLVEHKLYDNRRGPLNNLDVNMNVEALSNGYLDPDLMVARGAAIYSAAKGNINNFMHDGDERHMLNVTPADVLPGRVLMAHHKVDESLEYIEVWT